MPDPVPSFFATTRWTLVGEAARSGDAGAMTALGDLLTTYWQPLYRHARRRGKSPEDAKDLVQGFFAHLISTSPWGGLDRAKGRFRAFLLASFNHWLINEWKKESRQKRGGNELPLSLDWQAAENGLEPADERTPDRQFDRDWALALLAKVLAALEESCRAEGNAAQFEQLKACLTSDSSRLPFAELGAKLGISEGAARVAVHRLRKRYRHLLRDEIARTLTLPEAVDEEMQALFAALAG